MAYLLLPFGLCSLPDIILVRVMPYNKKGKKDKLWTLEKCCLRKTIEKKWNDAMAFKMLPEKGAMMRS